MTVEVKARAVERGEEILTAEALEFIGTLCREFGDRRDELLDARKVKRAEARNNHRLDFLPETAIIRDSDWQVVGAPADLRDRRVEITGPTDRKMTINALNSGARVWLADFEDASTPHWFNVIGGQVSLYDAVRRAISLTTSDGKRYALVEDRPLATIVVRPRGLHFDEVHVLVDGECAPAALVDFGLYFFHNAHELVGRGSGPYFYLPKLESHLEARWWNDVFTAAERILDIAPSTVRATVLIETIPAAFEMEEILYELRDHASGLNAGRWDYLFSIIKFFGRSGGRYVMPDRGSVGMTAPFMRAYAQELVRVCHKRGAFAIGGMAAFIPSRRDEEINRIAFAKVREDKVREADDGFDGSWVAHPDLVPLCAEIFTEQLGERDNQLSRLRDDVAVSADDLLAVGSAGGAVTRDGVIGNVDVSLRYLEAWLRGLGAVGINNLMEDAATVEISRSQLWQWIQNEVVLDDGATVTRELVSAVIEEQYAVIAAELGHSATLPAARQIFEEVVLADEYVDFLTLPAYERVYSAE